MCSGRSKSTGREQVTLLEKGVDHRSLAVDWEGTEEPSSSAFFICAFILLYAAGIRCDAMVQEIDTPRGGHMRVNERRTLDPHSTYHVSMEVGILCVHTLLLPGFSAVQCGHCLLLTRHPACDYSSGY